MGQICCPETSVKFTIRRCVIFQKGADLINVAAEAWDHESEYLSYMRLSGPQGRNGLCREEGNILFLPKFEHLISQPVAWSKYGLRYPGCTNIFLWLNININPLIVVLDKQ
jgi:hypothetical protein